MSEQTEGAGRVRALRLDAAKGRSLGPDGPQGSRVIELEMEVGPDTGHLFAQAVYERADKSFYVANWSEARGSVPEWVLEWARKVGIR